MTETLTLLEILQKIRAECDDEEPCVMHIQALAGVAIKRVELQEMKGTGSI